MSFSAIVTRLVLLLLAVGPAASCNSGKDSFPTAPAPPTLKVKPTAPRRAAADALEDDELDDEDEFDDETPRPMRARMALSGSNTTGASSSPRPGMGAAPKTINGHPEGPRAEVFNAVVNNALRQASACFAKEPTGKTLSFRVKMTVGNTGSVQEAKVISGPDKPKLRACLTRVVQALVFPPFKGPTVSQVIPFTAIRQ